ncbi:6,7-dimethyl-8-ribityllumazine synthase [Nakamurella sp. YIM 132087]|uniref:6,7-dimethyl-8-ribityllumazine synthase n=1 Tax=Nakamurella alba TaxID=2665158 RepID=A0A7K1FJ00_9ACTN|nr:6,7-dimethyl-8-ribityllumazine synthase [Nakamurella alba]MTD14078.1 6,7-dimethyl-8-ribityllumazine synthase [Nakamurella alba]
MSGDGRPPLEIPAAAGMRVGVVAASWNADLTDLMLERALDVCRQAGTATPTVVRVPGCVEIPVVAQQLAADNEAVIALGAVIRGATPHFDYVCDSVTQGLTRVSLDAGTPVGNGVLTCNTHEQAVERSGVPGSLEDKGGETAAAALRTALVLRQLRAPATAMGFAR